MTIAITGSTGHLGRLVIDQLIKKVPAADVVALARDPEKAADLPVSARRADYDQPGTLADALAGVDTLLLISGSEIGKRAVQHAAVHDAAKAVGVKHVVYTSLLHADRSPLSLADEHRATEAHLKQLGVPYTLLRNGWYTENYTESLGLAVAHGAVIGSAGEGRIAGAARLDFAEAAVAVLTQPELQGKTYELAGDSPFTLKDLAAELSRQLGKDIPYNDLPATEYANALAGAGLPEFLAEAIAGWDVCAREGALYDDSRTLSRLIGRPTTPLSTSVKQALAALPQAN